MTNELAPHKNKGIKMKRPLTFGGPGMQHYVDLEQLRAGEGSAGPDLLKFNSHSFGAPMPSFLTPVLSCLTCGYFF